MATVKLTDETFRDVTAADKPVLVDFWAEWCGPCKQIAPALDQISEELVDVLTVAKADIDETQDIATSLGVRGVPTLMLFKGGKIVSMKVGAMPKQKIVDWLAESGVRADASAQTA